MNTTAFIRAKSPTGLVKLIKSLQYTIKLLDWNIPTKELIFFWRGGVASTMSQLDPASLGFVSWPSGQGLDWGQGKMVQITVIKRGK